MEKICEKQSESNSYRRLLEYIKQQQTAEELISYLEKLKTISENHLKAERIFKGNDEIGSLIRKYKDVSKFFRGFPNGFLRKDQFESEEFIKFLRNVNNHMGELDLFIENARFLENLKFGSITVTSNPGLCARQQITTYIFYDKKGNIIAIRKMYSDCDKNLQYNELEPVAFCTMEEYQNKFIKDPNWILVAENNETSQCRYAYIRDFGFNSSQMPNDEELGSYKEPLTLKKHKKTIHIENN